MVCCCFSSPPPPLVHLIFFYYFGYSDCDQTVWIAHAKSISNIDNYISSHRQNLMLILALSNNQRSGAVTNMTMGEFLTSSGEQLSSSNMTNLVRKYVGEEATLSKNRKLAVTSRKDACSQELDELAEHMTHSRSTRTDTMMFPTKSIDLLKYLNL